MERPPPSYSGQKKNHVLVVYWNWIAQRIRCAHRIGMHTRSSWGYILICVKPIYMVNVFDWFIRNCRFHIFGFFFYKFTHVNCTRRICVQSRLQQASFSKRFALVFWTVRKKISLRFDLDYVAAVLLWDIAQRVFVNICCIHTR